MVSSAVQFGEYARPPDYPSRGPKPCVRRRITTSTDAILGPLRGRQAACAITADQRGHREQNRRLVLPEEMGVIMGVLVSNSFWTRQP